MLASGVDLIKASSPCIRSQRLWDRERKHRKSLERVVKEKIWACLWGRLADGEPLLLIVVSEIHLVITLNAFLSTVLVFCPGISHLPLEFYIFLFCFFFDAKIELLETSRTEIFLALFVGCRSSHFFLSGFFSWNFHLMRL